MWDRFNFQLGRCPELNRSSHGGLQGHVAGAEKVIPTSYRRFLTDKRPPLLVFIYFQYSMQPTRFSIRELGD